MTHEDQIREKARRMYAEESDDREIVVTDTEVDDSPAGGAWVSARLWVPYKHEGDEL